MKYNILPDELEHWENAKTSLLESLKQASNDAKDALTQSSETWHDNAPLDVARLSGEITSKRLREVQDILSNINIVSISQNIQVSIGKKISIIIDGEEEKELFIGGYQTPIKGRVSYNAPIVQPLLGKEIGDSVEIIINGIKKEIEIIDIK